VLLLAGYGFSGLFPRLGEFRLQSQSMQRVQQALPSGLRVPLPRAFVVGFDAQKRDGEVGAPAFFMGEEYRGTRPAYYPVAVLVKTPMATLLIVAAAGISMLRRRSRIDWRSGELPLLVTLLVFALGVAALATINIGVRYLLPAYPLAFVLAGRLWREPATDRRSRLEWGRWVLLGVLVVEHATVAPRYLTFFNALAGGPIGGQAILNDSNADWGQGLIELRDWMHANRVDQVQLAYFGRVDPGLYGIAYTPANQPGRERYIAVSSYYRAGLAYRMPTPEGMGNWARLPIAEVLRRVEPVAVVGDVIWVYDRDDIAEALRGAPARTAGMRPARAQ
jgi:4-amino-4-deoxy-L-arabinose transferase-like glycosyltransferase